MATTISCSTFVISVANGIMICTLTSTWIETLIKILLIPDGSTSVFTLVCTSPIAVNRTGTRGPRFPRSAFSVACPSGTE